MEAFTTTRVRMTGANALVYWGYRRAAMLPHWEIAAGLLEAELSEPDLFMLSQHPLIFTIDNSASGRPDLRRELLDVVIDGQRLYARVGPRK